MIVIFGLMMAQQISGKWDFELGFCGISCGFGTCWVAVNMLNCFNIIVLEPLFGLKVSVHLWNYDDGQLWFFTCTLRGWKSNYEMLVEKESVSNTDQLDYQIQASILSSPLMEKWQMLWVFMWHEWNLCRKPISLYDDAGFLVYDN